MTPSVHSLLCCCLIHVNRLIHFLEEKEESVVMYGFHVHIWGGYGGLFQSENEYRVNNHQAAPQFFMIAGQWRCKWNRAKGSAACNIILYQSEEISLGIWTGQIDFVVNKTHELFTTVPASCP